MMSRQVRAHVWTALRWQGFGERIHLGWSVRPVAVVPGTWCNLKMLADANLSDDDPGRCKKRLGTLMTRKSVPDKPE